MNNATENRDLDLSLRTDLANAAIAYANRCVNYAADPQERGTFDGMMDAEELLMDLVQECRDAMAELEGEFA